MPRSSAYSALWMCLGMWTEMSLKKMLKSVGERQLPCGTPVLVVKVDDVDVLHVTWKVRSVKKLLTQPRRCEGRLNLVSLWIIPS